MNKGLAIVVVAGLLAGCGPKAPAPEAGAKKRWHDLRAQMLYGLAEDLYRSGQLDKAATKCQEALALNEQCAAARKLLGKVLVEQGHYAVAAEHLRQVCDRQPSDAEALYLLAAAQEKQGNLHEALGNYRRSHSLDSTNLSAVQAAGEVLVAMGRLAEARQYVDSYIGAGATDAGLFEVSGRMAMMDGQYARAAELFAEALDQDGKNPRYREALGRARFLAGQYAEAIEALEPTARERGANPPAWVHAMLGECYRQTSRPREALDAYAKAVEGKPDAPAAWVNLANTQLMLGQADRAAESAQRALDLNGADHDASLVLGYALVKAGKAQAATEVLDGAVRLHPKSAALWCVLGRAHAVAGRSAEAVRCYTKALEIEPNNDLARQLLRAAGAKGIS